MESSTANRVIATFIVALTGTAFAADLRSPDSFASIGDRGARSRALFEEAGKVLQHPRCLNCHPVGERPTQGNDMQLHQPMAVRGTDGHGVVGMQCHTCHQVVNFEPSSVPGHPQWHLAPASMAWQNRSLGAICEQIKDRQRNGGKTLVAMHEHMAHDSLVGWGWAPGGQREPAPGTQAQFGALIKAWIDTGAACPPR
jgi:cytochrome c5